MLASILRKLRQISRRIFVRVILFAVLNLIALLAAVVLGPAIPADWAGFIGAEAVDTILTVLASSMLAVTTFSLTIMTAAFANAASNWTPRSHLILREDTRTHSVLATFLGSFLFALIAIVMRAAGVFDEGGLVILFGATLIVVAAVVISIIRWIVHLEGLGSLPFTAERLEAKASAALRGLSRMPNHGAHPLEDPAQQIPAGSVKVTAAQHGYLQQFYEDALQSWAAAQAARLYLPIPVGAYVQKGDVLVHVALEGEMPDTGADLLREALPIRDVRSFDQDPVFGVTVLAEVATRALSPGINDPGTAIDILHRLSHVLSCLETAPAAEPGRDRLWSVPLDLEELFLSSYDPIAREAGQSVETHIALHNALASVLRVADGPLQEAAARCAKRCRERAMAALPEGPEREIFLARTRSTTARDTQKTATGTAAT